MQPSEIISVNLWQIVVSLSNLVILFLIIKRFLYKPVKNVLKSRQDKLEEKYTQRITSRIIGNFISLRFVGRDIRQIQSY